MMKPRWEWCGTCDIPRQFANKEMTELDAYMKCMECFYHEFRLHDCKKPKSWKHKKWDKGERAYYKAHPFPSDVFNPSRRGSRGK